MRRFSKKKNYGSNVSSRLEQKVWSASAPTKEKVTNKAEYFNYKAFKELQNYGNIEVKADPSASATKGSYPYYIINSTNKVVDAKYVGRDNIEGNSITRLQNSNDSKLLNCFDIVTINQRINYLYLCYKLDNENNRNNMAANIEMMKAFQEAASKGFSTMLTQLPFFTQTCVTDMPNTDANGNTVFTGANFANYGKLGAMLHYQTVLQNAVAPLSKYIQLRSLEQTLMDMSYRRESQLVTQLFGQLKKSAFIAQLNAIGTSIIGEYFDANWYKQMNTIMFMASRKSNSMTDPLMTSTETTVIPRLRMWSEANPNTDETSPSYTRPYYDSSRDLVLTGYFIDPDTFTQPDEAVTITLEEGIYRLLRFLDASTLLTWARKLNSDPTSVGALVTPSTYYEQGILRLVNAINVCLTRFATYVTEIRTFIDKLQDSGMVYWKKGMFVDVSSISTFNPDYNKILADLIKSSVGGTEYVDYDTDTQRWQVWSLWNKYEGISEFDRKSGGSFLTLGVRKLRSTYNTTDISYCLPILFAPELTSESLSQNANKCLATNRLGLRVKVGHTQGAVTSDPVLSRLDPLMIGFSVRIPYIVLDMTDAPSQTRYAMCSALTSLVQTIAGYGRIRIEYTISGTAQHIETSVADPDYICYVDVQIDDLSNEMIQFCRNYSPFRVSTPNGKRSVGLGE